MIKFFFVILSYGFLFMVSNVNAEIIILNKCYDNTVIDKFKSSQKNQLFAQPFDTRTYGPNDKVWSEKSYNEYLNPNKKKIKQNVDPYAHLPPEREIDSTKSEVLINTTSLIISFVTYYRSGEVNKKNLKIKDYVDKIIIADNKFETKDSASNSVTNEKFQIDLKSNTIFIKGVYFEETEFLSTLKDVTTNLICKRKDAGSGASNNYLNYWWAIVLILAVIFFIYTQTKTELAFNKKGKNNLSRSFFDFFKITVNKNKFNIKEKKVEKSNFSKSENFLIKFINGEKSLAYSFWFMYTAITSVNELIKYILQANELLFIAGLFFILQWCYFIFATIGTWRSATNYKINKVSQNEGAGWANVVYIYLVISLLISIFRTIKSFI